MGHKISMELGNKACLDDADWKIPAQNVRSLQGTVRQSAKWDFKIENKTFESTPKWNQ